MCGFNDNTNKLKARENHIARVRRGPSFNLHSGFSFRLSKNICRAYTCSLPSLRFLSNQTKWGVWTWDFGSVLLKIKRFPQCLCLGHHSNIGICTGGKPLVPGNKQHGLDSLLLFIIIIIITGRISGGETSLICKTSSSNIIIIIKIMLFQKTSLILDV